MELSSTVASYDGTLRTGNRDKVLLASPLLLWSILYQSTFDISLYLLSPSLQVLRLSQSQANHTYQHLAQLTPTWNQLAVANMDVEALKEQWSEVEDRDGLRLSWNVFPSTRMVSRRRYRIYGGRIVLRLSRKHLV